MPVVIALVARKAHAIKTLKEYIQRLPYAEFYDDANVEIIETASGAGALEIIKSIGICNRRLGRLEPALDAYSMAQKISPDDPFIHFNKGRTLEDFSHVPDALACYRKALELDPNLSMATAAIERLSSTN